MLEGDMLTLVVFLMASSLALLLFMLVGAKRPRLEIRLDELAGRGKPVTPESQVAGFARSTLPRMGAMLVPKSEGDRTKLQTRLIHAGLYSRQAMVLFLGVKFVVIVGPALAGLAIGLAGVFPLQQAFVVGALLGGFGMIGPSFWLDMRKSARQTSLRRALPDALDVIVICVEGGGSFESALRRVAAELRAAHPLLASELNIAQREIQLGRQPGEALRRLADRADLGEIRSLASVILQAEKFGASLVNALRVHAESLRIQRLQRAEEMAQKAVVKMLFPTVLFILPAMFIVVLGPTSMQVLDMLSGMTGR